MPFISANQPNLHSAGPVNSAPVKFGCRLFAYMAGDTYKGQDEFIRQCLANGDNSLKAQSVPGKLDDLSETMPYMELLDRLPQVDGWGMVSYDSATLQPLVEKSQEPAFTDVAYDQAIDHSLKHAGVDPAAGHPVVLAAHLREGTSVSVKNTHPFRMGQWTFMQNGTLPNKTREILSAKVEKYRKKYDFPGPNGKTDSERIFFYMMGKLKDATGTTDASKVSSKELQTVFNDVVRELYTTAMTLEGGNYTKSSPVGDRWLTLTGPMGLNFILTDGNRIMASRYGRRLNIGTRHNDEGKQQEVLIATQPIQPQPASGQKPIEWTEFPEQHTALLEHKNGNVETTLTPYSLDKRLRTKAKLLWLAFRKRHTDAMVPN